MKQNKVAANLSQDYDTAEQKRARDNIGAMAASASSTFQSAGNYQTAGDYATRSELSNFVSVDQWSLKLDATASSLLLTDVNHDSNLTGSGTSASPLGLSNNVQISSGSDDNTATFAYTGVGIQDSAGQRTRLTPGGVSVWTNGSQNASWNNEGIHSQNTSNGGTWINLQHGTGLEQGAYNGNDTSNLSRSELQINKKIPGTTAYSNLNYNKLNFYDGASSQYVDSGKIVKWDNYSSSKMDASASSLYYSTSNPSGFITGYDTSNCLSAVDHDSNLTGDGTSGNKLGLNSSIQFTSANRQNTIYADKMELTGKANPQFFSGTYRPWGWELTGSASSTDGTTNPQTSIIQNTSYFSMYNTSDYGDKAQGYLTFRGCGFGESGTGGAGDERHTNISIEGITSISGYMGTASSHTGFYLTNGADADHDLELKFESGASSAKVDIDSINRWNSYTQGITESADPLGLGAQSASAAQTVYSGYNWTKRTVSASGLPAMEMYGFQTTPFGSGTYGINSAGSFDKINDQIVPYHTSDSALFARIGATTAAGKTPIFVGNSGTLMGYLGQISENKATFTKALSNGGTIVNYYVSSDNTVSSSQIRGFDGGVNYGPIHRSRIGSIYTQNDGDNNVWTMNGYCSGNWKWNDESDATHSLDEIYTGAAGTIDVYRYNWSFLICHSTPDSMDSSYVAYFDVSPCLQLWGTGGTYYTAWAPSNNHVMVPVSGYSYGGSTYQSQWQKLDLHYDIPSNMLTGWTRNSAYNTVIVSPRVQLVGITTTSTYHSLGIRMGTECVSFLNHL